VFDAIRLRGTTGAILWGYRTAAQLQAWSIVYHKPDLTHDNRWTLTATFQRVDRFQLRQRPLLFSAAREGLKGYWCWPLETESIQIGDVQMTATLGPPEQ
jgi:hypothetical protein